MRIEKKLNECHYTYKFTAIAMEELIIHCVLYNS